MPAKPKDVRDGGWGITYRDVSESLQAYQEEFRCTLEFSVYHYQKFKANGAPWVWSVVCHARCRRDTPAEVRGWGSCHVGHGSGAATMPGAMMTAMLHACDDLDERRLNPIREQELTALPDWARG